MAKKSEKIQMIAGGVILVFGLGIAGYNLARSSTLEVGEQCLNDVECKDGTCLSLNGESMCTKTCTSGGCPSGFSCEVIDVTIKNAAGFTDIQQSYCVPER